MRESVLRVGLVSLTLLAGPGALHASLPELPGLQDWKEVEAIERAARRGATYESMTGRWLLAPDGRLAVLPEHDEEDAPRSAMLGRYRIDGAWLDVVMDGHAVDVARLDAEQRAEYEAWQEAASAEAALDAERTTDLESAPDGEVQADVEAADDADAMADDWLRPRLLRVPFRGGELLVRESFLLIAANGWNGTGPLELMAEAWRLPKGVERGDDEYSFSIDDPLHAGLPVELTRLLRPDSIEARVVELQESAQTLAWRRHKATLHLRLDRGERAGLYRGMTMRGLPPDEDVSGEVIAVDPEHATLRMSIQRFSPRDIPRLPTPGVRLTTRWDRDACPLDFSAAVRGTVQSVATPPELVTWDEDGYGFFELAVDQGAAHGLVAGDTMTAQDSEVDGEGRVLEAGSRQATLLWRVHRYHESMPLRLPAAGDVLVTPAWRRAEWDAFGDLGGR